MSRTHARDLILSTLVAGAVTAPAGAQDIFSVSVLESGGPLSLNAGGSSLPDLVSDLADQTGAFNDSGSLVAVGQSTGMVIWNVERDVEVTQELCALSIRRPVASSGWHLPLGQH